MENYKEIATEVRLKVLDLVYKAQKSHIGSNLSCIDLLTVLYEDLNLDEKLEPNRDRVIYSKGWVAATAYVFLARMGIIPETDLDRFCEPGSPYIGLLEPTVRGVEAAGGAMGHGLPIGVGMAMAGKRGFVDYHTYVLMSDGEMNCGTTWESAMLASHHELNNLTVIVDYNKWQAMGKTNEVLNLEPLKMKWRSFNFEVIEINGHDYDQIEDALSRKFDLPKVIIANTIKGKGVSFMENKLEWHYKNISDEEYKLAREELSKEEENEQ